MKVKTLIVTAATAAIMPIAGLAGTAVADSPGQITADYLVKNLTQNTKYSNQTNANACEELEYSFRLHNPSYSSANNVVVKATLPAAASTTNTSNGVVSYTDGVGSPATGSVTVNLSSAQSITYENGSAVLYNGSGSVIKTLPDGITASGVNIGKVNGSTVEYVNFKAKVNCPKPECKTNCTPTPPVTPPATTTPPAPTTLVNTGPGETAALFAIAMIAGTFGYRKYLSHRLGRQ